MHRFWVDCNLGLQIVMVVEQIQPHQTVEHVHDYHHYEHSPPSVGLFVCGVSWWVVENATGSFCITNYITFWCCSLTFSLYVASMFGAFTSSSPISCTCCSSCFYACSWTGWCLTCSNCFLRLLVTTLNIFQNEQVLGKPLHYFWTIDFILFFQNNPSQ